MGKHAKTVEKVVEATPAEIEEGAEKTAKALEKVTPVEAKKKPPYYMAPGKAIVTKGIILSGDDGGDEVKEEHFPAGKVALDAFVDSGHILRG